MLDPEGSKANIYYSKYLLFSSFKYLAVVINSFKYGNGFYRSTHVYLRLKVANLTLLFSWVITTLRAMHIKALAVRFKSEGLRFRRIRKCTRINVKMFCLSVNTPLQSFL